MKNIFLSESANIVIYGLSSMGKTCLLASTAMPRYSMTEGVRLTWLSDRRLLAEGMASAPFDAGVAMIKGAWEQIAKGAIPAQTLDASKTWELFFEVDDRTGSRRFNIFDFGGRALNDDILESDSLHAVARQIDQRILVADGMLLPLSMPFGPATADNAGLALALAETRRNLTSVLSRRGRPIPIAVLLTKFDRTLGYDDLADMVKGLGPGQKWMDVASDPAKAAREWLASPAGAMHAEIVDDLRRRVGAENVAVFAVSALGMTVIASELTGSDGARLDRYWPDQPEIPKDDATSGWADAPPREFLRTSDGRVQEACEHIDKPGVYSVKGDVEGNKTWSFLGDTTGQRLRRKVILARRPDGAYALASFGMDHALRWLSRRARLHADAQNRRARLFMAAQSGRERFFRLTRYIGYAAFVLLVPGAAIAIEAMVDWPWSSRMAQPSEKERSDTEIRELAAYATAGPLRHAVAKLIGPLGQDAAVGMLRGNVERLLCHTDGRAAERSGLARALRQDAEMRGTLGAPLWACVAYASADAGIAQLRTEIRPSGPVVEDPAAHLRRLSNVSVQTARDGLAEIAQELGLHPDPNAAATLDQGLAMAERMLRDEIREQERQWKTGALALVDQGNVCAAVGMIGTDAPALVGSSARDAVRGRIADHVVGEARTLKQRAEQAQELPALGRLLKALDGGVFACAHAPVIDAAVEEARDAIHDREQRILYDEAVALVERDELCAARAAVAGGRGSDGRDAGRWDELIRRIDSMIMQKARTITEAAKAENDIASLLGMQRELGRGPFICDSGSPGAKPMPEIAEARTVVDARLDRRLYNDVRQVYSRNESDPDRFFNAEWRIRTQDAVMAYLQTARSVQRMKIDAQLILDFIQLKVNQPVEITNRRYFVYREGFLDDFEINFSSFLAGSDIIVDLDREKISWKNGKSFKIEPSKNISIYMHLYDTYKIIIQYSQDINDGKGVKISSNSYGRKEIFIGKIDFFTSKEVTKKFTEQLEGKYPPVVSSSITFVWRPIYPILPEYGAR